MCELFQILQTVNFLVTNSLWGLYSLPAYTILKALTVFLKLLKDFRQKSSSLGTLRPFKSLSFLIRFGYHPFRNLFDQIDQFGAHLK